MQSKCLFNILSVFTFFVGVSCTRHSPLDETDRMRFTIVDVSLLFLSAQSLLTSQGGDNVVLATKVFLESSLNVYPTTINEMTIAVTAQSLHEEVDVNEGGNATRLVLSTDLQILLKYQLEAGDVQYSGMDSRIRNLFSEQWDELHALLKVLDPTFFGPVRSIQLKPKSYVQPELPVFHGSGSGQREASRSSKPAPTVIIIFLVVGVGVAITLLTIFPLLYLKSSERPRRPTNRTMSTSQTDFGGGVMPNSSKDVAISESSTTLSDLPFDHSETYIQRVYSDDKVTNTLSGLRMQRAYAADRLRQNLNGIKRSFDAWESRMLGGHILLSQTCSTDNISDLESSQPGLRTRGAERRAGRGRTSVNGATRGNNFWIAPIIAESDESSVSTMSGGVYSDDEDNELDVLTGVPLRNHRKRSRGRTQSASTTDDFGSIAKSNPNGSVSSRSHCS